MQPSKLLYFYPNWSTFVQKDLDILESNFLVVKHQFSLESKFKLPIEFFKQFYFLIKNGKKAKVVVVQFAGYQSFIPVLLSKFFNYKTILVLGGTDTVSFPSIRYGGFRNKSLKPFLVYSLKHADLLLPVSETLVETDYTYQPNDFPKQGYKYFVPSVQTKYKVIYNGFETDKWYINQKEAFTFITTAANLGSRFGYELKGIDLIVSIAERFPQCKFYIVGGHKINHVTPPNVIKLGQQNGNELAELLSTKCFYLQLSMSEGFPNGLCEAMLAGCIPIVSNVGAMKMIVDNVGYILTQKNSDLLEELIQKAINNYSVEQHAQARERIVTAFSFEARKKALIHEINALINQ